MHMKLDFAITVDVEHLSFINADDGIGSNLSFLCLSEGLN